ncbi:unnamed protein product [Moneuplotes crassus]|uniref:TRP C-terminal domain-containing protein n=1 Tax=Euplotes crassus TaxID=5936 RepID=A0AAD1XPZ0_EUPCR|nr:unnamed protein product [Moneuplotes crassus]
MYPMTVFRIDDNWNISFSTKISSTDYVLAAQAKKLQSLPNSKLAAVSETRLHILSTTTGAIEYSFVMSSHSIVCMGTQEGVTNENLFLVTKNAGNLKVVQFCYTCSQTATIYETFMTTSDAAFDSYKSSSINTALLVSGHQFYHYSISGNALTLTQIFEYPSANMNLINTLMTRHQTNRYIFSRDSNDANNHAAYFQVTLTGTIATAERVQIVPVFLSSIYCCYYDLVVVYGHTSTHTFFGYMNYTSLSFSYQREAGYTYYNTMRLQNEYFQVWLHVSNTGGNPRNVFVVRADQALNSYETECRKPNFGTSTTITSSTIPSLSSSTCGGCTSTTTNLTPSSFSLSADAYTTISTSSCSKYMTTPNHRSSIAPVTFYAQVYQNISLDPPFCSLDASASVDVTLTFINGSEVSWLQFNSSGGSITGTAPEPNIIHNLKLAVTMTSKTATYDYTLNVAKCQAYCSSCDSSGNCLQCQQGSVFNQDSGLCEQNELLSVAAETVGTTVVVGTTMAVGLASAASVFSPRFSMQNLFTVSEYFQLLLTLLLLHTELAEKVYSLLQSFEVFKLDLEFIQKIIPINNGISYTSMNLEQSERRFDKIGIGYKSTLINFSMPLIFMVGIMITHLFAAALTSLNQSGKTLSILQRENEFAPMKCKQKWILGTYKFLNFACYIRFYLESLLFIMICALYEIIWYNNYSVFATVSMLLSTLIVISSIVAGVWLCVFVCKLKHYDIISVKLESVFAALNMTKKSKRLFPVVFIARRVVIVICIVGVTEKYSQFLTYFGCNLAHFLYICIFKPFDTKLENFIFIMTDVSICVLCVLYCVIMSDSDFLKMSSNGLEIIVDLMCYTIILTNFIIGIIATLVTIFSLKSYIKETLKRRKYRIKQIEINRNGLKMISKVEPQQRNPRTLSESKINLNTKSKDSSVDSNKMSKMTRKHLNYDHENLKNEPMPRGGNQIGRFINLREEQKIGF